MHTLDFTSNKFKNRTKKNKREEKVESKMYYLTFAHLRKGWKYKKKWELEMNYLTLAKAKKYNKTRV